MATIQHSDGAGAKLRFATAAVVRARYSLSGEQSCEGSATASRRSSRPPLLQPWQGSRLAPARETSALYALATLAYYAARANRAEEAQRLAERALACDPYPPPHDISTVLIVALTLVESYEAVEQLSEDLLGAARRRGAVQELAAVTAYRAWALCDRGALADAEADARWALERAQCIFRVSAASELIFVLTSAMTSTRRRTLPGD
jgi:hypothetical protein